MMAARPQGGRQVPGRRREAGDTSCHPMDEEDTSRTRCHLCAGPGMGRRPGQVFSWKTAAERQVQFLEPRLASRQEARQLLIQGTGRLPAAPATRPGGRCRRRAGPRVCRIESDSGRGSAGGQSEGPQKCSCQKEAHVAHPGRSSCTQPSRHPTALPETTTDDRAHLPQQAAPSVGVTIPRASCVRRAPWWSPC